VIKGVLAFAFFLIVPTLLLWIVIDGLRTGVVRGRGGPMARTDYPISYWIILGVYTGAIAMWVFFLGTVALDVWREGWN
jgi:hypothetical protein